MSLEVPFRPNTTYPRSYVLTQPYHEGPVSYNPSPHLALDMAGYLGQPVYAVESGRVWAASWNGDGYAIGGGYSVIIEHSGPGRRRARSLYAHLQKMFVKDTQFVLRGQLIGYSDTTGNATGSHLHFGYAEILGSTWADWAWRDPYRYMKAHTFQNGSVGHGDLVNSLYTRNTMLVGLSGNTNVRAKPYLSSEVVRTVKTKTAMVYRNTVNGTRWEGSRRWDKLWDPETKRTVYCHSKLTQWVV